MGSSRLSEELSELHLPVDFKVFSVVSSILGVQSPGKHKVRALLGPCGRVGTAV